MAMLIFAGFATLLAGALTAAICFANGMRSSPGEFIGRNFIALAWMVVCVLWLLATWPAHAHDHNKPDLDDWYMNLRSGVGSCCGGPKVDATTLDGEDWEVKGGHYRVRIDGEWVDVPDDAVLKEPNKDGRALVWPYWTDGKRSIRCFMPGSMG